MLLTANDTSDTIQLSYNTNNLLEIWYNFIPNQYEIYAVQPE